MGNQEDMRVYISGALLGASDLSKAREKYELTAKLLANKGFIPYLPHKQTDPEWAQNLNPRHVFAQDLEALSKADIVLAFLDEPSLGVGAEIALAIQQGKPVIGAHEAGRTVSRFICGLLELSRHCTVLEYHSAEDIAEKFCARAVLAPSETFA